MRRAAELAAALLAAFILGFLTGCAGTPASHVDHGWIDVGPVTSSCEFRTRLDRVQIRCHI